MRIHISALIAAAMVSASLAALAQSDAAQSNYVPTRDGGTREILESIFIPPMAHAPFQLTLDTQWTRPLANGGTYTYENERHIVRDSTGRIYEERWLLVPRGGRQVSRMNVFQIADPNKHTLYNCFVAEGMCKLLQYAGSVTANYRPDLGASAPLADGTGFHTHEELGANTMAGFDVQGYRDSTTINPGVYGNDQPMVTSREFWYAPQFGINLLSKVDSPQSGKQVFTVKEITSSEPEPQYFNVPKGYRITDARKSEPVQQH